MGNCISVHKRKTVKNIFNNDETPTKLSELKTKRLVIFFLFQKIVKKVRNVEKGRNEKRRNKKKPRKKGCVMV